jgi:hypothetical protein
MYQGIVTSVINVLMVNLFVIMCFETVFNAKSIDGVETEYARKS